MEGELHVVYMFATIFNYFCRFRMFSFFTGGHSWCLRRWRHSHTIGSSVRGLFVLGQPIVMVDRMDYISIIIMFLRRLLLCNQTRRLITYEYSSTRSCAIGFPCFEYQCAINIWLNKKWKRLNQLTLISKRGSKASETLRSHKARENTV